MSFDEVVGWLRDLFAAIGMVFTAAMLVLLAWGFFK